MFSTALDPVGCSITMATPPMACIDYFTCPLFLRSCSDVATNAASNIQIPRNNVHSAASPNLVRMMSSKKIPAGNKNIVSYLWIHYKEMMSCMTEN